MKGHAVVTSGSVGGLYNGAFSLMTTPTVGVGTKMQGNDRANLAQCHLVETVE